MMHSGLQLAVLDMCPIGGRHRVTGTIPGLQHPGPGSFSAYNCCSMGFLSSAKRPLPYVLHLVPTILAKGGPCLSFMRRPPVLGPGPPSHWPSVPAEAMSPHQIRLSDTAFIYPEPRLSCSCLQPLMPRRVSSVVSRGFHSLWVYKLP